MEDRMLYDSVLRSNFGNNFTWNRGNTFSKIDYIYLSPELLNVIKIYDTVWDLVKSDHAAICLTLKFNEMILRGRSYVKLSQNDLTSESDRESISLEINNAIKDFPAHWNPHQ